MIRKIIGFFVSSIFWLTVGSVSLIIVLFGAFSVVWMHAPLLKVIASLLPILLIFIFLSRKLYIFGKNKARLCCAQNQ